MEAASLLDGYHSTSIHTRIIRLKAFRYAYIQSKGTSSGNNIIADGPFTKPQTLTRLANFIMEIQVENGKWKGKYAQPLVLMAEKKETYLIVGVTPPPHAFPQNKQIIPVIYNL